MTQEKLLEQFIDRLGLRYFKGRELTPYWSRTRGRAKNSVPPEHLWPNIAPTLFVLDEIRHRLGYGIIITSSYRNAAYNAAVGGAPASMHMKFKALDFQGASGTPREWRDAALNCRTKLFPTGENGVKFVFRGGIGLYDTFVHVDTRKDQQSWNG